MSLWRLVPCLTLLLPSLGFAQTQDEWTPYTPPAEETAPPPPLVPAPPVPQPPPPQPPPSQPPMEESSQEMRISQDLIAQRNASTQRAVRLIGLPFTGAVTGMMGVIMGSVPTAVVAIPFCVTAEDFDEPSCVITVATGLSLSYSVGVTLGVTLVGNRLGGRGDGLLTFLSALAGAPLGSGIGISTQSTTALVLGLSIGPLVGATMGYELSHTVNTQPLPELQARSGFRVIPVIGATPGGGILGGLAGRF